MCASESGSMESPNEETGRSLPAPLPPSAAQPNGSNKIIGRNLNGTSKSSHDFFSSCCNYLQTRNGIAQLMQVPN